MRLTKIASIALLCIALAPAIACGSNPEQVAPGFTTYTDNTNGFSISVPDTWQTEPMGTTAWAVFSCPPSLCGGQYIEVSVVWITREYSGTAEDFYTETIEPTLEEDSSVNINSKEDITLDGVPAVKVIFTLNEYERSYSTMYYILAKGRTLWFITFHCATECWDTYVSTFDTMANSFHGLD